jgi:hypothetical protein
MAPPPSDWLEFWIFHFSIDAMIFWFVGIGAGRPSVLIAGAGCIALSILLLLARHLVWVP